MVSLRISGILAYRVQLRNEPQRPPVGLERGLVEAYEEHPSGDFLHREVAAYLTHRDPHGGVPRVAVGASADRRERDALRAQLDRARQRVPVARRQRLLLAVTAAAPDGADGVDDPARRQVVAGRHLRLAHLAASEEAAFREQP